MKTLITLTALGLLAWQTIEKSTNSTDDTVSVYVLQNGKQREIARFTKDESLHIYDQKLLDAIARDCSIAPQLPRPIHRTTTSDNLKLVCHAESRR